MCLTIFIGGSTSQQAQLPNVTKLHVGTHVQYQQMVHVHVLQGLAHLSLRPAVTFHSHYHIEHLTACHVTLHTNKAGEPGVKAGGQRVTGENCHLARERTG